MIRLTEHRDDFPVFWLADKLGDDSDIVQTPLSIGNTHDSIKPVNAEGAAVQAAVIPSVLRTRESVEVEIDTEAVFAGPADGFKHIFPLSTLQEWLIANGFDGPVGEW